MSDAEQPPRCDTLGCENPPVKGRYCAECADISPGILTDEPPEKAHRASNESRTDGDPDHNTSGVDDSATETPTDIEVDDREPPDETSDAREAFADAIAWFHDQLDQRITDHADGEGEHPDRPTTAREYFHERRWIDATIDDARLGWAPPSHTGLLDHLMQEGYDRDAILATGLFTEGFRPLW